jgi:hypothetical protein
LQVVSNQESSHSVDNDGPLEEIKFWRSRTVDLSGIRQQLDRPGVKSIVSVLRAANSSYLDFFSDLSEDIQKGARCFPLAARLSASPYCTHLVQPAALLFSTQPTATWPYFYFDYFSPLFPSSRFHRGRRESEFSDDSARVVHQPVQRGAKGHSRDSEGGVDAHPHDLERVVILQQGGTADWPAAQSQQSDHCPGLLDSLPFRVTRVLSWMNDTNFAPCFVSDFFRGSAVLWQGQSQGYL